MSILSLIIMVLGFTLYSISKIVSTKADSPARQIRMKVKRKRKIKKTILIVLGICCVPFTSPFILVAGFISGILIGIAKNLCEN